MKHKLLKIIGIMLAIMVAVCLYFDHQFKPAKQFTWGLDFSPEYASQLGFDPKTMFLDILADLKPTKLRLAADWDSIEPTQGQYNFQQMDEFLIEAGKEHVQVILGVGRKLPRWPECHDPDWAKKLSTADEQQAELDMIKVAINHFKSFPAITIWQVENEPSFPFNKDCPKVPVTQLKNEVAMVKSLDSRPVIVTDSGELGGWLEPASAGADLFGTTMYRVVHSGVVGYWKYPLPPWFFHIKAGILETFHPQVSVIGVELQAEPWLVDGVFGTPISTQQALMNPKIFAENIAYAKAAGFPDNYLWGVEWWYWMAKKNNDWGMWDAGKALLSN